MLDKIINNYKMQAILLFVHYYYYFVQDGIGFRKSIQWLLSNNISDIKCNQ